MSVITIYGASDDLVEVEGTVPGCDEYPTEDVWLRVIGEGKTTRIRVRFGDAGTWAITVAPLDEDVPMHEVTIQQAPRGHSALAIVAGVEQVIHEARREGTDA